MSRLVLTVALLLASAGVARADEDPTLSPDVLAWSDYAKVDALDLQGAVNTTGLSPEDYLVGVGLVIRALVPAPAAVVSNGLPIGGALGQRIFCIEGIESHHGIAMYNDTPVVRGGEHAQGWLGYLPSTAAVYGVVIGNRASEWAGAAKIIGKGEAFASTQFAGIGSGDC